MGTTWRKGRAKGDGQRDEGEHGHPEENNGANRCLLTVAGGPSGIIKKHTCAIRGRAGKTRPHNRVTAMKRSAATFTESAPPVPSPTQAERLNQVARPAPSWLQSQKLAPPRQDPLKRRSAGR